VCVCVCVCVCECVHVYVCVCVCDIVCVCFSYVLSSLSAAIPAEGVVVACKDCTGKIIYTDALKRKIVESTKDLKWLLIVECS
jgi:hypothetical protein